MTQKTTNNDGNRLDIDLWELFKKIGFITVGFDQQYKYWYEPYTKHFMKMFRDIKKRYQKKDSEYIVCVEEWMVYEWLYENKKITKKQYDYYNKKRNLKKGDKKGNI